MQLHALALLYAAGAVIVVLALVMAVLRRLDSRDGNQPRWSYMPWFGTSRRKTERYYPIIREFDKERLHERLVRMRRTHCDSPEKAMEEAQRVITDVYRAGGQNKRKVTDVESADNDI